MVGAGALIVAAMVWWQRDGASKPAAKPPPAATAAAATPAPVLPGPAAVVPAAEALPVASGAPRAPFADEPSYIRELWRLNETDKSRALQLARDGERWFPNSGVGEEARRAMVVTLLVDLGRMKEARDEVRRFIEQHPDSRYRPLVQGVTGIHPRPGPPNQ
jgi:hypothetical protein